MDQGQCIPQDSGVRRSGYRRILAELSVDVRPIMTK